MPPRGLTRSVYTAPRLKPRRGAPSRLCDQKSARRTGDQRSDERRHLGRTAISHVRASPNLRGPVIVGSGRHELGRPLPPRSLEVGHDDVTHHGSEQGGWREKLVVHRDNNFTQDGQAALPRVYTDIGDYAGVRSYRGRKRKWDRSALERLADEVDELGLPEACSREGIGLRHGQDLMRKAADAGLVVINKRSGPRSENVYSRIRIDVQEPSAADRADWHRTRWLGMRRTARMLQENWERQSGSADRHG